MSKPDKDSFDMSEMEPVLPAAAAALSAEDRAGLVNALKNKLQDLAGHHVDVLEALPPKVRKRVEALREIQAQHDELEAKFLEERAALEAKYQKLYDPLYTKRFEIVNGVVEVEGVTDASMEEGEGKANEGKGVPDFWLTAMKTNEILAEEISERDEEALKYLKDIKWCKIDNPKGFKLDFCFDTNPFFKNSVLTKTYHMINEDNEPILEKAIGTGIEWYPGKCLTQKVLKKKPKKGAKNTKPIMKTEKCESFFNFFSPPVVPDDEDDIDEDQAEELQNLMEQDYDIGSTIGIKLSLMLFMVYWEAVEADELDMDDEDDDDEEDEEDEEDEDEDEDDDEDEDEEKEVKTRKKKGGRAQAGEGQQGERPPECKQQ